MPKNTPGRIIDERARVSASFIGGGGAGTGVSDHGLLSGLTDDDHLHYLTNGRGDLRYVPLARTVTAGNGLSGGGALSGNISLALASSAAGAALSYTAGVLAVVPGEGLEIETDAIGLASSVAGNGLTYTAGVLAVGAGALITVGATTVGLSTGSAWQFAATGSDGAPLYRNVAALAGDGLAAASGVLAVGAGAGLTVSADAVALTTPGTLSVSTTNTAAGNHVHTVTSSADPDNSAALLATTAAGLLTLRTGAFRQAAQSQATFASGFAGSGWRVDYGITEASKASAEFDNLTVRGRMRVYEMYIQQVRATNGSLFVSSASKVVGATGETDSLWTVNGSQLTLGGANANLSTSIYQVTTAAAGDSGRELYHGFLVGDLIRSQEVRWNGSAYVSVSVSNMEVTGVTDLYTYQATQVSGIAPAVGADYVRIGSASDSTRRGAVYLTADDSNGPFIDIVDDVRSHADWNTAGKTKVRLGKLTGISDTAFGGALSGYGLYSNNVYLRGQIVVTGGSLGGLAAADINGNTTTIDGGRITTNSITANQIASNTITTTLLNFTPVLTGNVVASINATAEGLKIAANLIQIDGTTVFSAGYDPTGKIAAGGAAGDVNANVTTISGGKITTNSITADKLNVTDLYAIGATIGAWTIASNGISSTNIRMYSGDGYTARLELGDGTAARTAGIRAGLGAASDTAFWAGSAHDNTAAALYRVTLAGSVTMNDATLGTMKIDTSGAYVEAPSTWSLTTYGYKFKYGASVGAGLTAVYVAGSQSRLDLADNATTANSYTPLYNIDSTLSLRATAGGAGKTARAQLQALHGSTNYAGVEASNDGTNRIVAVTGTAFTYNTNTIWHAGNDGSGSGLDADLLDGNQATAFPTLSGGGVFTGPVAISNNVFKFTSAVSEPAFATIGNGEIWLYMKDGGSGRRVLMARGKGTGGGTAEATIITTGT